MNNCKSCRYRKDLTLDGKRYYDCKKFQFIDMPVCPEYSWKWSWVIKTMAAMGVIVFWYLGWINAGAGQLW